MQSSVKDANGTALRGTGAATDDRAQLLVERLFNNDPVPGWNRLLPLLREALAYTEGSWEPHNVLKAIMSGHAQWWPGEKSMIVTEIIIEPSGVKTCHIHFVAGDLDELLKMEKMIEVFARQHKCNVIQAVGRDGWIRKLPNYRKTAVVIRRDLEEIT